MAKILVADDEQDLRIIVKDFLESVGYQVVLATNGQEALELAAQEKPDLIILDMSMPIMNGWDVARRLRADPLLNSVIIVAFTAHALRGDKQKTIDAGCDSYISKPFIPDQLLEHIGELLAKRAPRRAA